VILELAAVVVDDAEGDAIVGAGFDDVTKLDAVPKREVSAVNPQRRVVNVHGSRDASSR